MNGDKPDGKIKSVGKSFDIVEHLVESGGAGVSEVADALGAPNSTAHDYLDSLHDRGYVRKDEGTYYPSMRFLSVGVRAREHEPLYRVGRSEVDALAAATGEFASVLCEEHGAGVYLYTTAGEDAVELDIHAGTHTPLHATAHGKCVLAALSEAERDRLLNEKGLPAVTDRTVTDRDTLREGLDGVRERGYAHDVEEAISGVSSVAAPVEAGDAVGAIGVTAPASRLTEESLAGTAERVVRAANVVEVNIRHS